MRTVNVAELRSHLSTYLARVRGGDEILIRDRSLAVAKLVPISKTENYGEGTAGVGLSGAPPIAGDEPRSKVFFALPTANIAAERMRAAFEVERDEG